MLCLKAVFLAFTRRGKYGELWISTFLTVFSGMLHRTKFQASITIATEDMQPWQMPLQRGFMASPIAQLDCQDHQANVSKVPLNQYHLCIALRRQDHLHLVVAMVVNGQRHSSHLSHAENATPPSQILHDLSLLRVNQGCQPTTAPPPVTLLIFCSISTND